MALKPKMIIPRNRLAGMVDAPKGDNARSLVDAAAEQLIVLRPSLEAYVRPRVKRLLSFMAEPDESLFAESRSLGAAALEIAEVAGAADMVTVGEIARGISAMVDSLVANGIWHSDALRVHLHALSLAASAADPSGGPIMLDRLRAMRGALGITE